jgi:hypothetical protein
VQGELSAHVITVSKLDRKKIAHPIECVGPDAQSVGIINMLDAARCGHFQRAKIDLPLLRPCATTWAIMRQREPLIADCALKCRPGSRQKYRQRKANGRFRENAPVLQS